MPTHLWLWIPLVLLIAWVQYITRDAGDCRTGFRNRYNRAWRRIVFWFGDIYRLDHAPYISFGHAEPQLDYEDAEEAFPLLRAGDVGLHREEGAASNLAIPGYMKHAWIHVNAPNDGLSFDSCEMCYDTRHMRIVEAVSEGVLKRHPHWPFDSKYIIILRPKHVSNSDIKRAVEKAEKIVGAEYDADFKFDIEDELERFGVKERDIADQLEAAKNLQQLHAEWDGGFSCTETVSFAWWHKRKELGLFRTLARGKEVILADSMINRGWDIVWMSRHVNVKDAKALGLSEEGILMIDEYLKKNKL